MKLSLSKTLAIFFALAASVSFSMAQKAPRPPEGQINPNAFYGPPAPAMPAFTNGPSAAVFTNGSLATRNGAFVLPARTLSNGGPQVVRSSNITAGGNFSIPFGKTYGGSELKGSGNGVIAAGGIASTPFGQTSRSSQLNGSKGGVIVGGGNAGIPFGKTYSSSQLSGSKGGVIVAGGNPGTPPGGTSNNGAGTGSASSVIVTGGSAH